MTLKILKAEQLVGGEEAMDEILSNLFNRELNPEYPYLTYQDRQGYDTQAEDDCSCQHSTTPQGRISPDIRHLGCNPYNLCNRYTKQETELPQYS